MTVADTLAPSTAGAPTFVLSPEVTSTSSSIDLPASACTEGTRIVLPSSTRNCLPPVLTIACAICLTSQTRPTRHRKVKYYRILRLNGQPLRPIRVCDIFMGRLQKSETTSTICMLVHHA